MADQNCRRNSFAAVWQVDIWRKISSGMSSGRSQAQVHGESASDIRKASNEDSLFRDLTSRRAATFWVIERTAESVAFRSSLS